MKKILIALSVVMALFAGNGCIKNTACKDKTVQSEQAAIINYAATQGISATAHSSGLYYQIGLPLIQKGGTIKLIVPSSLGYGCNGFGAVPGNSILYFEVELTDVQ